VFELKFSVEGILLVVSIVAVALFVGVYFFRVWAEKRMQRQTMEHISGESWGNFGEWSLQTVDDIEASYNQGVTSRHSTEGA
jgi:hypothetical protein